MNFEALQQQISAHWRDGIEIALIWVILYQAWLRMHQMRGARLLVTIVAASIGIILASQLLHLQVLDWILRNIAVLAVFALIVIFQPELRRMTTSLGNYRLFSSPNQNTETAEILGEMTFDLANRQLGALIAIEREVQLNQWAESGVEIDSLLSVELVVSIFHPKTPLHDGGLIIRGDRLLAGACIFPVTDRTDLDRNLGLRHRAGLGLTEESDAIVIVVSEETGVVSLCFDGEIERHFDPEGFKARLRELLSPASDEETNR